MSLCSWLFNPNWCFSPDKHIMFLPALLAALRQNLISIIFFAVDSKELSIVWTNDFGSVIVKSPRDSLLGKN